MCLKIWDRHMYDLYLNLNYGLNIEQVMNTKFNKDLIFISTDNMCKSHSDCDKTLIKS